MKKVTHTRSAPFSPSGERSYIAFNKPYAVLSQFTRDPGSHKSTLADFGFPPRVYPIGRLDYDSEGLLLLSDDPALNSALLDPKRQHQRVYLAQVEKIPDANVLRLLEEGVVIDGRKTLAATARLLQAEPDLPPRSTPIRYRANVPTAWIQLTLIEGKNRQVRRMTAAVGHPTLRLLRAGIGRLDLEMLAIKPGQWRPLTSSELKLAFERS